MTLEPIKKHFHSKRQKKLKKKKILIFNKNVFFFHFSEMSVRKIIMHPQYSSTKLVNDFAILRTRDVIPFTKSANAACLPE